MSFFDKFKKKEEVLKITMPATGKVIKLEEVSDPVFAGKMMGDGFAIIPENGNIYAPCDATVSTVFPTGHAIGLAIGDDIEILIHIGLDTVNLKGEGFDVKVAADQKVKAGDLLVVVDLEAVKAKVPSIATPIIFTKLENKQFEVEYRAANEKEEIGTIR